MKTKVIFRKYKKTGEILALFPEESYNDWSNLVVSYEHIGQHGGADLDHCIHNLTIDATEDEYNNLKLELESIGYELEIIKG